MNHQDTKSAKIRIICLNPPEYDDDQIYFGLQDKSNDLKPGNVREDGALEFACELKAAHGEGTDMPNFTGSFTHGTPKERFLYLSYGTQAGGVWNWLKRIKIPLKGITWEQVEAVANNDHVLEASVDGQQAATVKLIDGWNINT